MTKPAATRSLVIEREMPHSLEKIWRALTQGPLIEEWLMKNDFQPVVGHRFNFRTTPMPHWNGVTDCQVLVVEHYERLSYSWNASGEEATKGLKTVVTWTLTPVKGGRSRAHGAVGLPARRRSQLPRRELRLAAVRRRPGTGGRRAGLEGSLRVRVTSHRGPTGSTRRRVGRFLPTNAAGVAKSQRPTVATNSAS
jgi:uncharacterized protein YndB with AHSA1/START domain